MQQLIKAYLREVTLLLVNTERNVMLTSYRCNKTNLLH